MDGGAVPIDVVDLDGEGAGAVVYAGARYGCGNEAGLTAGGGGGVALELEIGDGLVAMVGKDELVGVDELCGVGEPRVDDRGDGDCDGGDVVVVDGRREAGAVGGVDVVCGANAKGDGLAVVVSDVNAEGYTENEVIVGKRWRCVSGDDGLVCEVDTLEFVASGVCAVGALELVCSDGCICCAGEEDVECEYGACFVLNRSADARWGGVADRDEVCADGNVVGGRALCVPIRD